MGIKHSATVATADDGTSEVGSNEWNADHALQIEGIVAGMRRGSAGGRYYIAGQWGGSPLGAGVAYVTNTLRAFPFIPARDCTVDQILAEVTTTGTSSRVGIWNDDGNCHPGTLLAESTSGAVSLTPAAVKTYAFATVALKGGTLYWVGLAATGVPVFRSVVVGDANPILGMPATLGAVSPGNGWQTNFTLAALGTWTASSEVVLNAAVVALAVRVN